MTASNKLLISYVPACLVYLLISPSLSVEFAGAVKILPIILLFTTVLRSCSSSSINATWVNLLVALLFSMGGDVLLELGQFIPGLLSFLSAQIAYSILFAKHYSSWKQKLPVSTAIIFFAFLMSLLMWNSADELRIPVLIYLAVISLMGLTATMSSIKGVMPGALVFIVSDSIIALDRFVTDIPASGWLIMISYYLAQYLLISSTLSSNSALRPEKNQG